MFCYIQARTNRNKMKYLIVAIISLMVINGQAQYDWPPKGTEGVDYYLNAKTKEDGLHYRTYPKGSPYYIGVFENEKPKIGTEMVYFYEDPTGTLMTYHKILSDVDSISAENYFSDGSLMSEGLYYQRKKNGIWKFYNEKGFLVSIEEYLNDELNGKKTTFYESGKVYKVNEFKKGVKHGVWNEFYESGGPKIEGNFLDGKKNGEIKYFNVSGRFDMTGNFKNDLKDGIWTKYNEDGSTQISTKYALEVKVKERRENGTFMDYYANGIPSAEHEYSNSKKNGPFTTWYNKGEWIREPVQMDQGGGMSYKEKLEGVQIERTGDYLDDKLEGEVIYYLEDGRIKKIETYSNGELISTDMKN